MQDTNGNQILIRYYPGMGVTWADSSARIQQIEDVRAVAGANSTPYYTYNFLFNSDPIPHLTEVANGIGSGEKYLFTYTTGSLISPFAGAQNFGNWSFLQSMKQSGTNLSTSFTYDAAGSGELSKVTFPYQGYLRWTYANFQYTAPSDPNNSTLGRTQREVSTRYQSRDGTVGAEKYYFIERDPGDTSLGRFVHYKARMHDVGAAVGGQDMVKVYTFNYDTSVWNIGLAIGYYEKSDLQGAILYNLSYAHVRLSA